MPPLFDHEKLLVYQEALGFIRWLEPVLEKVPHSTAVYGQLDRCSTSVPMNIAEGNGKYTAPDRCKYFDIARGSALECAAGLDVLVAKGKANDQEVQSGKEMLHGIVSKLFGLIRSNSPDRLHEPEEVYHVSSGAELDPKLA
jgi:four helix bundle protein